MTTREGHQANNALTTKEKWEAVWSGVKLPVIHKPVYDIQKQLEMHLPKNDTISLIEIGSAPGGWMAFLARRYGYQVSGIEYAEAAAEVTKINMKMLAIEAQVFVQDFFKFDYTINKYDIVLSAGFIEHFRDVAFVIDRICSLSKGYVITIVPNVFGVNGFISRSIRPKVYYEHQPINPHMLKSLHSNCGMKTLFCDYVGGVRFIMPGANNDFFNKHRYIAKMVNAPVIIINHLSSVLSRYFAFTPRSKLFSDSLMYIGVRI